MRVAAAVGAWAAAGALKNLALSPQTAETILHAPRAAACLCALARSPDWLEHSKARAALHFLQPRAAARPDVLRAGGSFDCTATGEERLAPSGSAPVKFQQIGAARVERRGA